MVSAPHFLLITEAHSDPAGGRWRFAVRRDTGRTVLEAADVEPEIVGPRLELLAAVRGLESLEYPSRVTLVTSSNYVRRGISYGLDSWRQHDWTWEWFGHMVPVKNRDLWRRIDRTLEFHKVRCRHWRIDAAHRSDRPHARVPAPAGQLVISSKAEMDQLARGKVSSDSRAWQRSQLRGRRWLREQADSLRTRIAQLGTGLLPRPWLD